MGENKKLYCNDPLIQEGPLSVTGESMCPKYRLNSISTSIMLIYMKVQEGIFVFLTLAWGWASHFKG